MSSDFRRDISLGSGESSASCRLLLVVMPVVGLLLCASGTGVSIDGVLPAFGGE